MNKIKYVLLFAILITSASSVLIAADEIQIKEAQSTNIGTRVKMPKRTPEQKATAFTDTLNSIVSLSPDQYQKAYTSNLKYVMQKEALKNGNTGNIDEIKAQMKVISKTRKSEISAILTTEQVVKWQAWKQVRKEQGMTKKDQFQKNHPNATGKIQQVKSDKPEGAKSEPLFDDIGDM